MQIFKCKQRSDEWFELKKQYPFSASKAQAIATQGVGLETLVNDALVAKYSKGIKAVFTNEHLERGNELEEHSRAIYELENGVTVEEVGFIVDKNYSMAGVSPDGLIGDDGLVEIKCLEDTGHLKKLLDVAKNGIFKVDSAHEWQMQMQMLISGRKWCDYAVFNPNFEKSLLVRRIQADPEKQEKIKVGLKMAESMFKEKESLLIKLK